MVRGKAPQKRQPQEIDNTLKALFGKEADKILPKLIPDVEIITDKNIEIDRTTLRADLVYLARCQGQRQIVDMELQTHGTIETRLLQYFAGLHAKHGLPVIPVILYPFKTTISESPYEVVAGHDTGISFKYLVLCLWKMEAQPFVDEHAVYLYTLLPAMKGANAALLKLALKEMQRYYTRHQFGHHLVRFGRIMAQSSTLSRQDKREIEEELRMQYKYDYFIDENPEVIKRVMKKEKESLAQGRIEGKAQGLQQSAMLIVSSRFPILEQLARPQIERITIVDELNRLIMHLAVASSEVEVRTLLDLP